MPLVIFITFEYENNICYITKTLNKYICVYI